MFQSTKMFERLGYVLSVETEGHTIFIKRDGKEEIKIHFDTVNQLYKCYYYVNGRRFFTEWVDFDTHRAIQQFITERQWK